MTRPRLAKLQAFAAELAQAARRRAKPGTRRAPVSPRPPADGPTADELARRLDETRNRLRRDIPPRGD